MSFGTLRPGDAPKSRYERLDDGRWRLTHYERISHDSALTPATAIPVGTLYRGVADAGSNTLGWANIRLLSAEVVGLEQVSYWQRIYETQSATGETQIGGARLVSDEDGRDQLELTYRQFTREVNGTAIPYVKGEKGAAAPGYANTSLASESMTDNGAWRIITRRYDFTNATPANADELGPVVVRYPFNAVGDAAHVIASQRFRQPATNYAPLALNASRVVTVGGSSQTLYYVGDIVPPRRQGSTLVEFVREWANKPASRSEWGTIAASFPGLRRTQAEYNSISANQTDDFRTLINLRSGFSRVVTCRIDFDYFRIAASGGDYTSPANIPLIAETSYRRASQNSAERMSPFEAYLSDADVLYYAAFRPPGTTPGPSWWSSRWNDLLTVPTRTQYYALGAYGVVLECRIRRYIGNIYERRTVRVTPI